MLKLTPLIWLRVISWWWVPSGFLGLPYNALELLVLLQAVRFAGAAAAALAVQSRQGSRKIIRDGWPIFCVAFWLVVWNIFYFPIYWYILGISSSQLTFIFFRGVAQPPTSLRGFVTRGNPLAMKTMAAMTIKALVPFPGNTSPC